MSKASVYDALGMRPGCKNSYWDMDSKT